jgi:hypothetical protein
MMRGLVHISSYWGRLGNQLAQYCFARRLAEELEFDLDVPEIAGFPNATSLGTRLPQRRLRRQRIHTAHQLDIAPIVRDREPRCIELSGIFLRLEYFAPYRAAIRDLWLRQDPTPVIHPDALTIHVRSGDLWAKVNKGYIIPEYRGLPFSFYEGIVRGRAWKEIHIVSEDAGDPLVEKLAKRFSGTIHSTTALADFNLLRASRNLVLSVSSYAWWAAWLSNAERIYFPVTGLFNPERARKRPFPWQQDLWVPDDDRYIQLSPNMPERDWHGTEDERFRLLHS